MKSASFPSLRVDTEVREAIERRRSRAEFIARGLASREDAKRTGVYFSANAVHVELGKMLAKATKRVRG